MRPVYFLFTLTVLSSCGQSVQGRNGTMDDWIRLTNTLLTNYSKDVDPVYNLNETLFIDTGMFILSILDFDEVSGVITFNGGLYHTWTDFRLSWNPQDYGGIENILVSSSLVWKPSVFIINTAEDLTPFDSGKFEVRVMSNGRCIISPGRRIVTTCSVDMTKFPVDAHICEAALLQWGVMPEERALTFNRSDVNLDWYTPNGEWTLVSTVVENSTYPGGLRFTINISRKPVYFTLSLIIPIVLLCFLNPFVFLLPASSGERISYTITMFLSMAVYMSIIGDSLPKVSENMAGMSFFLLISLIYSGCLIVLTIFTLRFESLSDVKEFPNCIKRVTTCLKKRKNNKVQRAKSPDFEEECEKKNDSNDVITKDDVKGTIDKTLFITSFAVIVIFIVIVFSFLFV
ncbi:neuronal acetylcholine receptor subunit alpha-7-like [Argopecten irradians]|uniref:neuronal acetylcholine receptor subunit alpha-7-like n=1 Tax=Argopecten irradians TaxID=31199 RepID=UPI00371B7844